MNKLYLILFSLIFCISSVTSVQNKPVQPIKRFLDLPELKGASFSLLAKDVKSGKEVFSYDPDRLMTPASVLKLVTTATALEVLGKDFRFETGLAYDGEIINGVLHGNLYIQGGGDPTLGSSFVADDQEVFLPDGNTFLPFWIEVLTKAGIHTIKGQVVADERIFDNEGLSRKWVYEDLGSYYGAGCYGLSVFDNQYKLILRTGPVGGNPMIKHTVPEIDGLQFKNSLKSANVSTDSTYILGMPFVNERYLYGVVPSGKESYTLRGDIPDPPLFLAQYVTKGLLQAGIDVTGNPTCFRLLAEQGNIPSGERIKLCVIHSPALAEIASVTNRVSHNLYADALLKMLGVATPVWSKDPVSSFDRGVKRILDFWKEEGIETSNIQLYDGSGLAMADKVTATFICDLLIYMMNESKTGESFMNGIPRVGIEGSVRNFLKGSKLQGKARLKSGSMSGVKAYAGYIEKNGHTYAIALIVNSYPGEGRLVTKAIEQMLLSLF